MSMSVLNVKPVGTSSINVVNSVYLFSSLVFTPYLLNAVGKITFLSRCSEAAGIAHRLPRM